jgi:hypothetical protein
MISAGCSFYVQYIGPHGVLNDVSKLLWCVLCIGGRRVRGFRPPRLGFQPWENSRLVVVAVQGAPPNCYLCMVYLLTPFTPYPSEVLDVVICTSVFTCNHISHHLYSLLRTLHTSRSLPSPVLTVQRFSESSCGSTPRFSCLYCRGRNNNPKAYKHQKIYPSHEASIHALRMAITHDHKRQPCRFGRFTDWGIPSEFWPFNIDPVVNLRQTLSFADAT